MASLSRLVSLHVRCDLGRHESAWVPGGRRERAPGPPRAVPRTTRRPPWSTHPPPVPHGDGHRDRPSLPNRRGERGRWRAPVAARGHNPGQTGRHRPLRPPVAGRRLHRRRDHRLRTPVRLRQRQNEVVRRLGPDQRLHGPQHRPAHPTFRAALRSPVPRPRQQARPGGHPPPVRQAAPALHHPGPQERAPSPAGRRIRRRTRATSSRPAERTPPNRPAPIARPRPRPRITGRFGAHVVGFRSQTRNRSWGQVSAQVARNSDPQGSGCQSGCALWTISRGPLVIRCSAVPSNFLV